MLASFWLIAYLRTCFNRDDVDPTVSCKNSCKNLNDYKTVQNNPNCYQNPDVMLKVPALIKRYDYDVESHEVKTPDGYILVLFRIPPKDGERKKQAVYLQYGFLGDPAVWLHLGNDSLAFVLADAGYDVWLGNSRESGYSRRHVLLQDTDNQYWDYSWDEIASNDIKASLEEVYRVSGQTPIIYIGHSKGAALALMYASEYPEEAKKLLRGIIAICPAVYFDVNKKIYTMMKGFTVGKNKVVFRDLTINRFLIMSYCIKHPVSCFKMMNGVTGEFGNLQPKDFLLFLSNFPTAFSTKEMSHMLQLQETKKFRKFDYGPEENLRKYGQETPPTYNLSAVEVPVHVFYGKKDGFVTEKNVEKLFAEIGSKRKFSLSIPVDDTSVYQFNHIDFTTSEFARKFFYDYLLDILKEELSV